MVEILESGVEIKKVDSQGRLILPADWRETEIGENVFIGSDTMLVAPLKIGKGARTGAGSVVTKDVPENTLVAGVPARAIRKLKND